MNRAENEYEMARHLYAALTDMGVVRYAPGLAYAPGPMPLCRCAPGICEDLGDGLVVKCDTCGGLMFASTLDELLRIRAAYEAAEVTAGKRPDPDGV